MDLKDQDQFPGCKDQTSFARNLYGYKPLDPSSANSPEVPKATPMADKAKSAAKLKLQQIFGAGWNKRLGFS